VLFLYLFIFEVEACTSQREGQIDRRTDGRTNGRRINEYSIAGSATLRLKRSCDYEIYVDAKTTPGYNTSLQLRPLFVASQQQRT